MMNGKDSVGRRISLLNDNDCQPSQPSQYSSRRSISSSVPSLGSRASSVSTPSLAPGTPPLVRSASTDSAAVEPISPITPAGSFDSLASPPMVMEAYFSKAHGSYAQMPVMSPHEVQAPYYTHAPVQAASGRVSSAPKVPTKKNQYPCPVAKQFNCLDYFTTSGHAARHAKKHTGRKDAKCPECNKAFTRKDNMEQHRRTHQTGRGAGKSDDSRIKKVKTVAKRPRPAPLQPSMATPDLESPGSSTRMTRPFFERSFSSYSVSSLRTYSEGITPGVTNGLHALAIAASEQ